MADARAIPAELARLAADPRVLVRRGGLPRPDARCVVYWMQRSVRIADNPALDAAVAAANVLGLPVVVFVSAAAYPDVNLRHYHFLMQGLRDVSADAAARGVGFVLQSAPNHSIEKFLEDVRAALLIGDENPIREQERRRGRLARRLRVPYWAVDADVVVPSRIFGRDYFLLHHFRPHLRRELPGFLAPRENIVPIHQWRPARGIDNESADGDITRGFRNLDRSVQPVDTFIGGAQAAMRRLREFVRDDLTGYEKMRIRPEAKGTSRLSPYLHFGNISPITVALAVNKAADDRKVSAAAAEKFLDELIGWRELAILFVRYNAHYDDSTCAEPWAKRTLAEHARDLRAWRYSLNQLERGRTHDGLWNAAQCEMVSTGWMHNTMRMYWAKKILEWAPDPATAFDWAVILNDKYQLDGSDPNGYAGIAWAIVGKHDRPWFSRPVTGAVRSMTEASTRNKFDSEAYIRLNSALDSESLRRRR